MSDDQIRVAARANAIELTADEIRAVSGGHDGTHSTTGKVEITENNEIKADDIESD